MKKDKVSQKAAAKITKDTKSILNHPPPKLQGGHYQTLLLYHGIPKKNHGKTVGEAKAKYLKLKEDNTPPKEVKEWTQADKDKLTKLMSKIVTIEETDLPKARKIAAEEDELRLIAMCRKSEIQTD